MQLYAAKCYKQINYNIINSFPLTHVKVTELTKTNARQLTIWWAPFGKNVLLCPLLNLILQVAQLWQRDRASSINDFRWGGGGQFEAIID